MSLRPDPQLGAGALPDQAWNYSASCFSIPSVRPRCLRPLGARCPSMPDAFAEQKPVSRALPRRARIGGMPKKVFACWIDRPEAMEHVSVVEGAINGCPLKSGHDIL